MAVARCTFVAIDVQALLRRVVAAVFDADVEATYSTEPKAEHVHHVRLTAADGGRHAGPSASYEGFGATILDLGVSTSLLDHDHDDEEEDEEEDEDEEAVLERWRWSSARTYAGRARRAQAGLAPFTPLC